MPACYLLRKLTFGKYSIDYSMCLLEEIPIIVPTFSKSSKSLYQDIIRSFTLKYHVGAKVCSILPCNNIVVSTLEMARFPYVFILRFILET